MGAVVLRFYPNQKNPARKSGFGVYRVDTWMADDYWPRRNNGLRVVDIRGVPELVIRTDRVFKKGSRVDPLRILSEARAGRQNMCANTKSFGKNWTQSADAAV